MKPQTSRSPASFSLISRGAREQFAMAIALTSILPLLTLTYLLYSLDAPGSSSYTLLAVLSAVLMTLGYILLSKYPRTILKLRRYLDDILRGELPVRIEFQAPANDIAAVETCMNTILDRLKEKVRDMEAEQARLERQLCQNEKMRTMGLLAAGIVHEIKTPVQFVGDNLRFLADANNQLAHLLELHDRLLDEVGADPVAEPLVAEIHAAEQEADLAFLNAEIPVAITQSLEGLDQVADISRAMKDFSLLSEDEPCNHEDINKLIEKMVRLTRNEWKYVADLRVELDPQLPLVPCRPGDMKQVLVNLIINAAQAIEPPLPGQPQGQIVIRTWSEEAGIAVAVSDNGTGIPPEIQKRIFQPFFTTKRGGKGTGQGLPIVKSLIEKTHGGRIGFETTPGRGTTFVVRLPFATPAEPTPREATYERAS